jgi:hypothetical protein
MITGMDSPDFWAAVAAACEACRGLTPGQVAAIPRLIALYTAPAPGVAEEEEYWALREIFPERRAAGTPLTGIDFAST